MHVRIFAIVLAFCAALPAVASVSIYMPPEDLARRADLVVEGSVSRTASGFDPIDGTLATYVTLQLDEVHRGPAGLEQVTLREAGGRFGDLVHEIDAVPVYEPGERVLAYLRARPDGSLRTVGMFYGKFDLGHDNGSAVRDLGGQGTIFGRAEDSREPLERWSRADLVAVAATVGQARARAWRAEPAEMPRLRWEGVRTSPSAPSGPQTEGLPFAELEQDGPGSGTQERFVALSATPARWNQSDAGEAVTIHVQRSGSPLENDALAVDEVVEAMRVWSDLPQARITLQPGDTDYDYTTRHSVSPATTYTGDSVILFDDPYGDIDDPVGCSGVLAVGGYWRTNSIGSLVHGMPFRSILQLYVIFNNDFECYLAYPGNLAEIAAHELGHGIGFGHSPAPDALMRATAWGARGARLGDDDVDAAHCNYPHGFTLTSPDGSESLTAGESHIVSWESTVDSGTNRGEVTIELSVDDGASWVEIASDEPNDGHYDWQVPDLPSDQALLRVVRHLRGGHAPASYPRPCSGDRSDSAFIVETAAPHPHEIRPLRPSAGRDRRISRPARSRK